MSFSTKTVGVERISRDPLLSLRISQTRQSMLCSVIQFSNVSNENGVSLVVTHISTPSRNDRYETKCDTYVSNVPHRSGRPCFDAYFSVIPSN